MRPAHTYRAARREQARRTLKALRAQGERANWRQVWAAARAVFAAGQAKPNEDA